MGAVSTSNETKKPCVYRETNPAHIHADNGSDELNWIKRESRRTYQIRSAEDAGDCPPGAALREEEEEEEGTGGRQQVAKEIGRETAMASGRGEESQTAAQMAGAAVAAPAPWPRRSRCRPPPPWEVADPGWPRAEPRIGRLVRGGEASRVRELGSETAWGGRKENEGKVVGVGEAKEKDAQPIPLRFCAAVFFDHGRQDVASQRLSLPESRRPHGSPSRGRARRRRTRASNEHKTTVWGSSCAGLKPSTWGERGDLV
jgi:hypothetical protein